MVIQWSTLSQTDPVDIALLADDGSQVCAGGFPGSLKTCCNGRLSAQRCCT